MQETIGQQLQRARQSRGLSLEEAAQAICIRARYIEALETDNRAGLPSRVQGRGFLRNYAEFLKLPVQPLLDQWDGKAVPEASIVEALPDPGPAAVESQPSGLSVEGDAPGLPEPVVTLPAVQSPPPPAAASHAIFVEIGRTLKAQRELLSLSLTEVEKYTHVRVHYLKALEDGKMEELPSMVQGRGMLNNYARFLNLDAEAVMNRFADALQTRREEMAPPQPTRRPPPKMASHPALKRLLSMDLLVGGGMVVVLVLFVVWGASQVMAIRSQDKVTPTAPSVSDVLAVSPEPTEDLSAPEISQDIPTADVNAPIATDPALAQAGEGTPEPGTAGANNPPPPSPGKFQVYIVALQRAWMKVTVDGRVQFVGRTVAGNAYPFEGSQTIELVTGNGAALQVYYNQEELGTLGNWSEVVDMVFSKDQGVQTPTPTASPTPTRTPRETPTPTPTETRRPGLPYNPTLPSP